MNKELIDIINEDGIKTGDILPRSEIHKKGLWHRSIIIAIINEKKEILLQQRSDNKEKNAGMWDISVAGHVEAGQDAISAALRELKEEMNIELRENDYKNFKFIFSYRSKIKYTDDFIENQFYEFFILQKNGLNIQDLKIQKSEVQSIKFANLAELQKMITQKKMVDREPIFYELIKYLK